MQIVILDGYTANPGDLSWKPLESLGQLTVYDRTASADIIARSAQADIVITNKTVLTADILRKLPKLKFISLLSTGTNAVDLSAARILEIPVANVPGYSTPSVAQMTFALIQELALGVGLHARDVRQGGWTVSSDFCYWKQPLLELSGKTLGIIGYGAIGREVEKIAYAYGMKVLIHSRTRPAEIEDSRWCSLEEILPKADILTLHCPLTHQNAELINKNSLAKMKQKTLLINTARGGLINEADLAYALNSNMIGGAGLDVLSTEPPEAGNPLLTAKNCLITPHIAWASQEARKRLLETVVDNLKGFIQGCPVNIVNGKDGKEI